MPWARERSGSADAEPAEAAPHRRTAGTITGGGCAAPGTAGPRTRRSGKPSCGETKKRANGKPNRRSSACSAALTSRDGSRRSGFRSPRSLARFLRRIDAFRFRPLPSSRDPRGDPRPPSSVVRRRGRHRPKIRRNSSHRIRPRASRSSDPRIPATSSSVKDRSIFRRRDRISSCSILPDPSRSSARKASRSSRSVRGNALRVAWTNAFRNSRWYA
mmetsp:Transcript_3216/g.8687  ORF Transcript_3216/g.8687 Transcript_3216/m.8687 type:complete len:216 (+) Transcript_3216:343-990(+)